MARARPDFVDLTKDPAVRWSLGLLLLLATPYLWSGFSTDTLATYAYYSDVPLHLLVIGVFLARSRRLEDPLDRRFWFLLAGGYSCWCLVKAATFAFQGSRFEIPESLVLEEVLYLLFYLLIAAALELRPDLNPHPPATALRRLEIFAGLIFAFGLMVYLVVIPSLFDPAAFSNMLPAALLYVTADLYLAIRLWTLRTGSENSAFRRIYHWLWVTASLWLLFDLYDVITAAGFQGALAPGTLFEALWTIPALTAIVAARLPASEAPPPGAATELPSDPIAELWMGRTVVYVALLPLLHFVIEAAGLLQGSTRARSYCLMVVLAVLSLLALLHDRVLAAERKMLVEERRRVRSQLALSQSMAAVRRLAGGIAHDFNNMLMVVRGHAEWLARDLPPTDKKHGRAQQIVAAADRAAELTGQLVRMSQSVPGRPAPFDLNRAVRKVEAMLRSVVPADIRLELELSPHSPTVLGEPAAFEDAVVNLVINARDAIETQGTITLRTTTTQVEQPMGPDPPAGRYGIVEVRDDGSGIDADILPKVFEPFFSTKIEGRGTGLGLSMVYSYADQNGGKTEVESEPGNGSTFRLWLPVSNETARPEEPAGESVAPARTGTVLLVDDELEVRKVLGGLLHGLGWQVLEASGGEDACQVLGQHARQIDVLLSDVVMPGMDGAELAEVVQRTHPEIAIVFMTAYAEDGLRRLGNWAQSATVVTKPCSAADLDQAISDALGVPTVPINAP